MPLIHPTLPTKYDINNITTGDAIPCEYVVKTSGSPGIFSDLGSTEKSLLPTTGTPTPDGSFFFIAVEPTLLIADRVVQTNINWNNLNLSKMIDGSKDFVNYAQFNNYNSWAQFNRGFDELINSDFTVDFYSSYTDTYRDIILGSAGLPGGQFNIEWYYGKIRLYPAELSVGPYTAGQLYRVTVSIRRSDGLHQVYINNTLIGSKNYQLDFSSGFNPKLGANSRTGSYCLSDKLSDFKIFKSFKTPQDIDGSTPTDSDVLLWYDFKNSYENTMIDSSSNGIHATSYNVTYNEVGNATGYGLIRSLSGGNSYLDMRNNMDLNKNYLAPYGCFPINNEWDTYIMNSTLGGKITPGDNNIWNYHNIWSLCSDTGSNDLYIKWSEGELTLDSSPYRTARGYFPNDIGRRMEQIHSIDSISSVIGFRPVLQLKNTNQTTLYY